MPTTTNMNMVLPTVGATLDPTWASNLNDALTNRVDVHDHTSGYGVQVPTAGLNINADLSLQSNDLTDIRSLSLNNNVSTLPSGDIRAIYASGGNLYYNNNSGNAVRITNGSSLDTGSLALNVWSLQELAGNLTILTSDSFVFINTNTSTTRTITLPIASGVTAGRYYIIKDKTGSANTNNITITPAGSDTIDGVASSTTISSSYGSLTVVSDGVSGWLTNAAIGGFIQLGGDLLGTGSTTTAPRVSGLTGISGLVTMANNTALNTRNVANDTNVNLAKLDSTNNVRYGDSAFDGYFAGSKLTLTAGTSSIAATATTTASITGGTGLTLKATTGTVGLTATAGAMNIIASGAMALTSTGSTFDVVAGGNITIGNTSGDVSINGNGKIQLNTGSDYINIVSGTDTYIVGTNNASLTASNGNLDLTGIGDTTVTASNTLSLVGTDVTTTGKVNMPAKAVTATPYTVDTTTKDYYILVDTNAIAAASTINLPSASTGRMLIIKDVGGKANNNPITLHRAASESIDGTAADYVMDINYQGVTLANYGGDWFTVGQSTKNDFGVISQRLNTGVTTTSTSAQNTNLTFKVKSGEIWTINVDGGCESNAGESIYVGFTFPGSSTIRQSGYCINGTPNYGTDTIDGPFVFFSTAGADAPFHVTASFIAGGDGTVTFQYKSGAGATVGIRSGTSMIARRGVSV